MYQKKHSRSCTIYFKFKSYIYPVIMSLDQSAKHKNQQIPGSINGISVGNACLKEK